mmetsp:Transcript_8443/g.11070  ORF Transcript_8443/g.11070 Transcript_8443/m.11070 type:complete len:310 (+) Transcript_8443:82-1011(+)
MSFPKSNQFASNHTENCGTCPSELRNLTTIVSGVRQHDDQPFMNNTSRPEGMAISTSFATAEYCADHNKKASSSVESFSQVAAQDDGQISSKHDKRANYFPEILMDILSNPNYTSIASWLPHGKSFVIYNSNKFSTEILPKYFRRVIFRSFVRKLNRWGFRTVKRSVSGFDSTFEHKYFIRDQPELCVKMRCKSAPVSKIVSTRPNMETTNKVVITPSTRSPSDTSIQNALNRPQVPQTATLTNRVSLVSRNVEFPIQSHHELLLQELRRREMEQRRQWALIHIVEQMSGGDIVSQSQLLRMFQQRFES